MLREEEGGTEDEDEGGNLCRRQNRVPVGQLTNSSAHSVTASPYPGPRKGGGVAPLTKPLTSYLVSLRWRNVSLALNQRPS